MNAPRKPTSLIGRLTWHLHHPLVAIAALAALVLSVRSLPGLGPDRWIDRLAGRPVQVPNGNTPGVYLLRKQGDPKASFEIINVDQESADRISRLSQSDQAKNLLYCYYSARVIRRGMWYPSNELAQREVQITSLLSTEGLNGFKKDELALARRTYLDWLASPTGGKAPKEALVMAEGDVIEQRMIWPEFMKNVGSIAAIGVLLLSLWGMPQYFRVWRAKRLIRKGRCGVCRYDLKGIERGDDGIQCPECGAVWP